VRPRRSWPPLYVALVADRGVIRSHLAGRGMPGTVCGLSAVGAIPVPDVREKGRITCPDCVRMAPWIPAGWAA
jgi:hypothetical protein